jgi:hypothetical protein
MRWERKCVMGGASSIWENISCVGHHWLRGTLLAAWGYIGCVGQYHVGENILRIY